MEIPESDDSFRCFVCETSATASPLVDDAPGALWSDVAGGCGGRVPPDEETSRGSCFCFAAAGWSLLLVPAPPLGFVGTFVPFSASVSRLATFGLEEGAWGGVGVAKQARRGIPNGRKPTIYKKYRHSGAVEPETMKLRFVSGCPGNVEQLKTIPQQYGT